MLSLPKFYRIGRKIEVCRYILHILVLTLLLLLIWPLRCSLASVIVVPTGSQLLQVVLLAVSGDRTRRAGPGKWMLSSTIAELRVARDY
jgi:hypothetical protein